MKDYPTLWQRQMMWAALTAGFVVVLVVIVAAVIWEYFQKDPIVDVRMFRNRNFALAFVMMTMLGFALFGTTVLIPQYLQTLLGYTAQRAGMALSTDKSGFPKATKSEEDSALSKVCSIYPQMLQLISRTGFDTAVRKHKAKRHARGFSSWGQFVAMLFCQLASAKSLREIWKNRLSNFFSHVTLRHTTRIRTFAWLPTPCSNTACVATSRFSRHRLRQLRRSLPVISGLLAFLLLLDPAGCLHSASNALDAITTLRQFDNCLKIAAVTKL